MMTKEDRAKFNEMYEKLEKFIADKFDPGNGNWKTARAVFEQKTIDALKNINSSLDELKECTRPLPELTRDVKELKAWRTKQTKILFWLFGTIVTPILATLGYIIANKLW